MSVYFITCRKADSVKIGSSLEPHARLREIQAHCPLPLALEAVLPGGQQEEFAMHWRFSEHRLHGEWFTITEMMEAIIVANPSPAPNEQKPEVTRAQLHRAAKKRKLLEEQEEIRASSARLNSRFLTREQRKRIASGDIHFPFRSSGSAA